MWTFPGSMRMQGDSGRILEQVLEALKAKASPRFKEVVAARLKRIKAARDDRIARAAKLAADKGRPGAINPHYLTAELAKLLGDQDMIFNEGVTNAAAVLMQTLRDEGGSANLTVIPVFSLLYSIPVIVLYLFVSKRYGFRFHGGIKA